MEKATDIESEFALTSVFSAPITEAEQKQKRWPFSEASAGPASPNWTAMHPFCSG
jgi:hypothetical protein